MYVRTTGGGILVCPEMTYQLDILEPLLYRPSPDDVKPNVVVRKTYWLRDESASVYRRASLVLSLECHSPIIAAAAGAPCIYVHQPEDGIKVQIIQTGGWAIVIVKSSNRQTRPLAARVLEITGNPVAAARRVNEAVHFARNKQSQAMRAVTASADRANASSHAPAVG